MPVERVGVEIHLRIEAQQLAVPGHNQRIDLEQAHILVDEQPVDVADHLHALADLAAGEAEREGDLTAMEREVAGCRIDRQRDDFVRRVVGDLLDIHAARL